MPRTCTICSHAERAAIEAAIVAGTSNRVISRQFHVSHDAVRRHKADHLPARLAEAHEAREVSQADELLKQVRALQASALRILIRAEREDDRRSALAAIREARSNLELLAKLLGELSAAPQVNILLAPEWVTVRAAIMDALAPYVEARIAVAQRLMALDGSGSGSK
jgi:hypothetical protein